MYINKLLVQLFLLRCSNFLKKNSLFEFGKDFFLQKFFKFFFKKIPIFRRKCLPFHCRVRISDGINPSDSVGFRRSTFLRRVVSRRPLFRRYFRRKNTLFPSVFPSQIGCIFVVFQSNSLSFRLLTKSKSLTRNARCPN